MENYVTLIDQFGSYGMIVNTVDRVMKTRMTFEVLNVLDRAGRQIVYHVDLIATLNIGVTQMRSDKTGATCDKYSQISSLMAGASLECGGLAPLLSRPCFIGTKAASRRR